MNIIGYLIYYEDEVDKAVYSPISTRMRIVQAIMYARPEATVCIKPVEEIPEGVIYDK